MKKITRAEFEKLPLTKPSISSEIKSALMMLEVDEGFIVQRDEWQLNSKPMDYFASYASQANIKLTIRSLSDRTGWAVLRIE